MGTRRGLIVSALVALASCSFERGSLGPRDSAVGLDDSTVPDNGPGTPNDVLLDATADGQPDGSVDKLCPASYVLLNTDEPASRYRLVTASDDWVAAEAACENDGGGAFKPTHLVVLDDEVEQTWVYAQGTTDKWVGATDLNTEGTYQAVTDQAAPFFGAAASNSQPKDCMFVNQTETVLEACDAAFQYICECDGAAADPANF